MHLSIVDLKGGGWVASMAPAKASIVGRRVDAFAARPCGLVSQLYGLLASDRTESLARGLAATFFTRLSNGTAHMVTTNRRWQYGS